MSLDQFEDAPADNTSQEVPSILNAGAFQAPNGANTALPIHSGLARVEREKGAGGWIDDVAGVGPEESSNGDVEENEAGEGEEWDEQYEDEEDDVEIEDEDWEVAERDFTKQFNRMRQTQTVSNSQTKSVPLPARNSTHRLPTSSSNSTTNTNAHASSSKPSTNPTNNKHSQSNASNNLGSLGGVSSNPKAPSSKLNQKDKSDRATVDAVLDPRTRAILAGMIRRGIVKEVEGCISTGKEANVYYGLPPDTAPIPPSNASTTSTSYPSPYPTSLALKIFKTSILTFKSRSIYIQGSHRFKNSYTKMSNPRKMVKTWAEKELRNLRRLEQGGIRCPRVVEVRENVLCMEFLGDEEEEGKASPRLKDAQIPSSTLPDLYAELLITIRRLYQVCKLVHADLSEYNILYHQEHLFIIDVSQSVEHDHPSAFDFLRKDILNVEDFFKKKGGGEVRTLGGRKVFDFVVKEQLEGVEKRRRVVAGGESEIEVGTEVEAEKEVVEGQEGLVVESQKLSLAAPEVVIEEEDEDALREVIRKWLDEGVGLEEEPASNSTSGPISTDPSQPSSNGNSSSKTSDDNVFMSSFIPRSLAEVYDPERDTDKIRDGEGKDLIYADVVGLSELRSKSKGDNKAIVDADEEEVVEEADSKLVEAGTGTTPATPSILKKDSQKKKGNEVRWKDEEEDEEEEDQSGDEVDEEPLDKKPRGFRHEDRDAKKERKKALKEENREKRKGKMPKAEKAKLVKKTAGAGK